MKTAITLVYMLFMLCSATAQAADGILVWKLQANKGVEESDVNLISNFIANQVATISGRKVISEADINTILKGEETRQRCGAEDTMCVVEIGNAMGVPEAISGDIGKIGSYWMLNLRRINVHSAEVISRSSRNIEGSIDHMIRSLPGAVAELFGLKPGEKPEAYKVPDKGIVKIKTLPEGAPIKINGEAVGYSPLEKELKTGQCKISAELRGYKKLEIEKRIFPGRNEDIVLKLERVAPGVIDVQSEPGGAEVWIDGEAKGKTPYKDKLAAGEHRVEVKLDGYKTTGQAVTVKPKETANLSLTLERDYPMNPYKKYGYVSFFTGAGLMAFGGFSTWAAKAEADDYKTGDWGAADRNKGWKAGMGLGFGLGGAAMVTGIVLWALSPGDEAWWKEHSVSAGPAADGEGAVVMFGGRW